MTCALPGTKGTCTKVPGGYPDTNALGPCMGTKACDGQGNCKTKQAQTCTSAGQCATNLCVDGYCCYTACTETCKSCGQAGTQGFCTDLPFGQPDKSAAKPCYSAGLQVCDGSGGCVTAMGKPCTTGAQCISKKCVDGYCCAAACDVQCKSCDVTGKEGGCEWVPAGQPDKSGSKTCDSGGTKACDGKGSCRKANGQTCLKPGDCGSGYCVDGYCCATVCTGNCLSCGLPGKEGSCTPQAAGTDPDQDCIGKDPTCGGKCDGAGKCVLAKVGIGCGTCKTCDGAGQCNSTPPDDSACGVIDCDKLDSKCRDYKDLTAARCVALGQCKKPNDPVSCKAFSQLCNDAGTARDRGREASAAPTPDQGQQPQVDDDGGCQLARFDASAGTSTLLLLLAWFCRVRRRCVRP